MGDVSGREVTGLPAPLLWGPPPGDQHTQPSSPTPWDCVQEMPARTSGLAGLRGGLGGGAVETLGVGHSSKARVRTSHTCSLWVSAELAIWKGLRIRSFSSSTVSSKAAAVLSSSGSPLRSQEKGHMPSTAAKSSVAWPLLASRPRLGPSVPRLPPLEDGSSNLRAFAPATAPPGRPPLVQKASSPSRLQAQVSPEGLPLM